MTSSISRRVVLQSMGAASLLGGLGLSTRAAMAQSTSLRAAITGYSVINTLDPAQATLIPEYYVMWSTFNGLMKFDADMKLVPDLAESYSPIETGGFEFKLRPGVKFHNGEVLSSEDVKFSFERVMSPDLASPNASKLSEVSKIETPDPLTVRIHTKAPYAPLLTFLSNSRTGTQIINKKAFEEMGADAFSRAPVGTGAYKVKEWNAGEGLTLEAHPEYFEGAPSFAKIEVPLIAEEASGVTALKGGQIDMTSTVPAADVAQLMKDDSVTLLRQPGLNTRFISINLTKAPFDDIHFRRAISMAFQREAIVQAVLFGEGVAADGIIPPQLAEYQSGTTRKYMTYNPEAAKAELAKSKYKPDEMEVPVITWGGGWWKRFAEIFVAQVNQVLGTKLTVEVTDANAAYARQKSGDFVAGVWGWLGMVDPDEYVGGLLTSTGWRNFQGYSNAQVDELAAKGAAETDPAKRPEFYKQAEDIAMDEVALIPCFFSNISNLLRPGIEGFDQKAYSNYGDQFYKMKEA
ncbi:ABC transporter substrate-binding protein [Thioclava kandeliae]|uniref:ABC transporter substrate-binding protein n=1 Tax=Thioclava kandeliae TaxID=3070818 RepID=A0ABV1SLU6_9RHOB